MTNLMTWTERGADASLVLMLAALLASVVGFFAH